MTANSRSCTSFAPPLALAALAAVMAALTVACRASETDLATIGRATVESAASEINVTAAHETDVNPASTALDELAVELTALAQWPTHPPQTEPAYPGYPPPTTTPWPTHTPSPTVDLTVAFPPHATPEPKPLSPVGWSYSYAMNPLVAYEYELDGRKGVQLVDARSAPASPVWNLHVDGGPDLDADQFHAFPVPGTVGEPRRLAVGATLPNNSRMFVLDITEDEVRTELDLVLPFQLGADKWRLQLGRPSLTVTGEPWPVLVVRPSEGAPSYLVYSGDSSVPPFPQDSPAFVADETVQFLDRNGDETFDIVQNVGRGKWSQLLYAEASGSWHEGDELTEEPRPLPELLERNEPLPPLPADLYWQRDRTIYRWPAEGGERETMLPVDPDAVVRNRPRSASPSQPRVTSQSSTLASRWSTRPLGRRAAAASAC